MTAAALTLLCWWIWWETHGLLRDRQRRRTWEDQR